MRKQGCGEKAASGCAEGTAQEADGTACARSLPLLSGTVARQGAAQKHCCRKQVGLFESLAIAAARPIAKRTGCFMTAAIAHQQQQAQLLLTSRGWEATLQRTEPRKQCFAQVEALGTADRQPGVSNQANGRRRSNTAQKAPTHLHCSGYAGSGRICWCGCA